MRRGLMRGLVPVWLLVGIICAARAVAAPDKGAVEVSFDGQQRTFNAAVARSSLSLEAAGLAFQIDGRRLTSADSTAVRTTRQAFHDVIGAGQEWVVDYQFGGDVPKVRYEIKRYDGRPWLAVTARFSAG